MDYSDKWYYVGIRRISCNSEYNWFSPIYFTKLIDYPLMAIGTVAIYARSYSSPVNSSVGNNRLVSLADSTEANRVAMTGSGAVDTVLANTAQAGTQTQDNNISSDTDAWHELYFTHSLIS